MTEKKGRGGAREGAGRPSRYRDMGETGERFTVWLPPSIAKQAQALGDGSLSAGIVRAFVERADA